MPEPQPKKPQKQTAIDKLDLIYHELRKINKRARLQMILGFIKNLLIFAPLILLLLGGWFAYTRIEGLLTSIADIGVHVPSITRDADGEGLLDRVREYLP